MFGRRRPGDFSAEIESHLNHEVERLRELGLSDGEARAAAQRSFGNIAAAQERFYESGRWLWWDHLRNDVRYAFRLMAKDARLSAIIIVTLALGIGANSIIFSAVRAVVLRPLPYQQPERLVQVWDSGPRAGGEADWVSFPDFRDWHAANRVFEDIAAWRFALLTMSGRREPEAFLSLEVTDRLFAILGVAPELGRTFLAGEDKPGHEPVAIISHALWQHRFHGDRSLPGQRVNIEGKPYTIVGVMPPQFRFPSAIPGDSYVVPIDLWIPMRASPDLEDRDSHNFWTVARLKKDMTLRHARANMAAIAANLTRQYPQSNKDMGATVMRLQDHLTADVGPAMTILLVAVGLVLLLVCVNIASLLLSRAQSRARELAIRASLGAGRSRLVRQALTESLLLAALGGTAGILIARYGITLLVKFGPANIPRLNEAAVDGQVTLFTAAVALAAGVLCGVAPALLAAGTDLHQTLKELGARATATRKSIVARSVLVTAEMALAIVLLTGAGLLIRSFARVVNIDPGFRAANVFSVVLSLPASRYPDPAKQAAFFEEALRRIRAVPGIEAAAVSDSVPLSGSNDQGGFRIEGRTEPGPGEDGPQANRPHVSSQYFETMGIPLLRGRVFNQHDRSNSPYVAVISDLAAHRYWPNEDPIGKRVAVDWVNGRPVWRQIVGIVGSTRQFGLEAPQKAEIYIPHTQSPQPFITLVVRSRSALSDVAAATRREIAAIDPDLAGVGFQSMDAFISTAQSRRRFQVLLLGSFAGLAAILAAIGIYGVMVNTVVRRTREIGVRLALGAAPRDAAALIVKSGLQLAFAGIGIGLTAAIALVWFIRGLLFGVSPFDPLTFVAAAALLAAVAMLSAWIPARAAARVDPVVALREE